MSIVNEELGFEVSVACGVSDKSIAAKAVCNGHAVWIVQPQCSKNSGHWAKTPWSACCDPCRTLLSHNSWTCLHCGHRAMLKADLL